MLVFDIETDGLLDSMSTIHCIHVTDSETGKKYKYDKEECIEGVKLLHEADICGHNIIAFDVPAIKKIYPWFSPKSVYDTMVAARLAWADIKLADLVRMRVGKIPGKLIGSHSLKAYGYRLGILKGDFGETTDWKEWSQEMSDYCEQDVEVTVGLLEKLQTKEVAQEAMDLEHDVQTIIARQINYGFLFDVDKAELLYAELVGEKEIVHRELLQVFTPWLKGKGTTIPKKTVTYKPGKLYPYRTTITKGAEYTKLKLETFNPGSRDHIAYQLKKRYGWKPKEFSETGKPKIDESVLSKLDYPEVKPLLRYLLLDKRLGQLAEGKQGWLGQVKRNSRIHGYVNSNGAVTGRMTHSNPNVAQVPSVSAPYGEQCRELFRVPKKKKLVGCDASGLELRCLAHYMARYDKGEYAKVILEGDIHTENQNAAGLPTRNNAKTFIYAFLYGAGDEKIGSIVGGGSNEGKKLKAKFFKKIPAIKKLVDAVKKVASEKGYLIGLDGRKLSIRSEHAALNVLLQSAGALIMKKALVILDEDLRAIGLTPGKEYEFVANIHDEFQIEVDEDKAELVGEVAQRAIQKAGEAFNFRCPLDGEYKIGNNWKDTH